MIEASDSHDHVEHRDDEHDQVGTVDVQILLSWFFDTAPPDDVAINLPRAA